MTPIANVAEWLRGELIGRPKAEHGLLADTQAGAILADRSAKSERRAPQRKNGVNHATQSGSHTLKERGLDLYETPSCATEALLRAEQLPHGLWEPAAGRGAIVNVLRAHGYAVATSDIYDYGFPLDFVSDFLTASEAPAGIECILTNPPFKLIGKFVRHALDLCPRVIMLARLAFLETEGRSDILERRGLARVHVFRNRLPMMHRDGWNGPRASSAVAFAWFCWNRDHHGPTVIDRISWIQSASDKMEAA